MVNARRIAEWDRTAMVAALIFNQHNPKPKKPRDFNPFRNVQTHLPKLKAREVGELLRGNQK